MLKIPSFLKLSKYVIEGGTILYFFGFIALSLANSKYGVVAENIFSLRYVTVALLFFVFIFVILFLFKKTLEVLGRISEEKKPYINLLNLLDLLWTYLYMTIIIVTLFNIQTSNFSMMFSFSVGELGSMQKLFLEDFRILKEIPSVLGLNIWQILGMIGIAFITLIFYLTVGRLDGKKSFLKQLFEWGGRVANSITKGFIYFVLYFIGLAAVTRVFGYMKDMDFFVKDTFEGFPIASILIGCVTILYFIMFFYGLGLKDRKVLQEGFKNHTSSFILIKETLFKGNRTLHENGYIILAVVLIFIVFSYAFYRYTPAYLFGGQLRKVEITFKENIEGVENCELYLIDNQPDTLLLLKECSGDKKTIEISKEYVDQIIYEREINNEKDK
jgi:hypothetical protein